MGIDVYVHPDTVDITFVGLERILSLKDRLILPMDDIVSARVRPVAELKQQLGWRVGGAYWPGLVATGHYTVRGRKGARQLWCVQRDREALVIDTRRDRPCRVVLQHPDRHNLAWLIGERIHPPAAD
jgi:hypothetical protein